MTKDRKFSFTICSNNYLGQANALKKSFLKHNPDFHFIIILVDKLSPLVDYKVFQPAQIIPVETIKEIDLETLISKYDIIELNTSIKPTVFKYIYKNNPNAEVIYYLDPDLYFYNSLEETNEFLKNNTAVLTPHILTPIERDEKLPNENIFLNFGTYNLGFIGLNPQNYTAKKMLDWWEERTIFYGYNRPKIGYFVDQLWMNLAPIFFSNIVILKTNNYNMGPWNLHERHVISIEDSQVILNDNSQLVFYHFSKIAGNDVDVSREYNRFTLLNFPLLNDLYQDYKKVLKESHFYEYKNIPIAYPVIVHKKKVIEKPSFMKKVFRKIGNWFNNLGNKF